MAAGFVISFATMIYSGPLSPSLNRGIGLSLLGCTLMSGLGSLLFSYRGMIVHPQDVTAVLLATASAAIAAAGVGLAQDALFATVAVMVALAAALAGVACLVLGRLRLGFVARYLPYPVLGGFLAATGYLLFMGGIGIILNDSVSLWTLGVLFEPGAISQWLPWTLAAGAIAVTSRYWQSGVALPLMIAGATAFFYVALAVSGMSLDDALQKGWLLGPFPSGGFLTDLHPSVVGLANWTIIAEQAPVLIAIVAMTVIGALLNIAGINHIVGHQSDTDADLRATGYSNLLSASAFGLVGYPTLGETALGSRFGIRGPLAGGVVALVSLGAALFGASVLEVLPRGLFGMLLAFIGLDLLSTWIWTERKRLQTSDFAIVLLILAVAATVGFLEAIALGILVSMTLFVVSYARLDFIRLQTTLANRRSMVERADAARGFLEQTGGEVAVLELTGILFFGTANRLRDRILSVLRAAPKLPETLVLDFRRVRDIDASAAVNLERTFQELGDLGIEVQVASLTPVARLRLGGLERLNIAVHPTLDDALEMLEENILGGLDPQLSDSGSFLGQLKREHPAIDVEDLLHSMNFERGGLIVEEGKASDEIFILVEGEASAIVKTGDGIRTVARFLPGALIGEMAYYGGDRRSASVRADTPVRVLKIDAKHLGPDSPLPAALVSSIHRLAAGTMSKRLARTTRLLRDAEA